MKMLKINQKKKRPSTAQLITKPKETEKPQPPKPMWNDLQSDLNKYKLSQAELV